MSKQFKTFVALVLSVLILCTAAVPAFAAGGAFGDNAYATVITVSDLQDAGAKAYNRFGDVLQLMADDGLTTPNSVLVGGDFTKILFDDAIPGVTLTRNNLKAVFPDADDEAVVCIQGNHDNPVSGLNKTGFYDMGVYCLYIITEDDFPWQQGLRPTVCGRVRKLAEDMTKNFNAMIENGDTRPVIVMTHLPLHHTYRANYADNKYAAYIFDAINKAAEKLDMIFLFGHQHSGDYDDYIGGSVNFLAPGDTIRVPLTDKSGENCYSEETLNFTYLNCGYLGYSNNHETETSTNILTLGAIRFKKNAFRFVKYSEKGFYRMDEVKRKNAATEEQMTATRSGYPEMYDRETWEAESGLFGRIWNFIMFIVRLLTFRK